MKNPQIQFTGKSITPLSRQYHSVALSVTLSLVMPAVHEALFYILFTLPHDFVASTQSQLQKDL